MSSKTNEVVGLTSWRVIFSDQTPILSFIPTLSYSITMAPSIETQNQLQTWDRDTIFETQVQLETPGKNLLTKEKEKTWNPWWAAGHHVIVIYDRKHTKKMGKITS